MTKLLDYGFNKYSQFGEDGIIQRIFQLIGTTSQICVEFGAWDGFHFANTANLWTNGWQGVLIEADASKYLQLVENVSGYNCQCIQAFVVPNGTNSIENILQREGIAGQIDLMSIDIDGDDYYIFESLHALLPRVVVCEYNPTIPAEIELIPAQGNYFGCSAAALVNLAGKKGYMLVAMTESNCFFVLADDFPKFKDYQTSIEELKFAKHLTYLITGYDGSYIASQEPTYGCSRPSSQKFLGEYFAFPRPTLARSFLNLLRRNRFLTPPG